jgi:NodT family efflux transporter outer membrane factor (OMF) lipoprotein
MSALLLRADGRGNLEPLALDLRLYRDTCRNGPAPRICELRCSNARRAFLSCMLSVALFGSGCTPGYRLLPPAPPSESHYLQPNSGPTVDVVVADITQQHVSEGTNSPDDWWTLLRSEDLDRVVRLALANNQSLAAAQAHLAAAWQRVASARGPMYPQLDAVASIQRSRFGAPVLGPEAERFPNFSAYAAGVQVSYDFDVFGGTRRLVENAVASARYEAMQRDAATLSVSGNVVLEALQIASLGAQIRVVEQIIVDDESLLRLVRAEHDEGMVSKTDVLIALSQTDHDRTLLPPLRQGLSAARDALAILVGAAPVDWAPPEFDFDTLTLPLDLPVALPSELVHRRPDILAAEAQLQVAGTAVGIATANLYPHLILSAPLAASGLFPGGPSEVAWTLLGGLTAPIFHGGSLRAEQRAAQDDYRSAFAAYREVVLEAFGQVADSLQALVNDAGELVSQQRALDSASDSLELTRDSYEAGTNGYVEVLDSQRLREQAVLGWVEADTQRYVDSVKLLLAAGGRVDPRLVAGG